MDVQALIQRAADGVTLLGAEAPSGVTLAFTGREGGVSEGPHASLNLNTACGDDPARVASNRARALAALGAEGTLEKLLVLNQVHGDEVVVVRDASPEALSRARATAEAGADAFVVTAQDVPALVCTADCLPVAICAPGGFAVVHSGWRGTIASIAAKAARILADETGASPELMSAYIGPCIRRESYEVSPELAERFTEAFGPEVADGRMLDLPRCVELALLEAGLSADAIQDAGIDTFADEKYFSFRRQEGVCGRNGLIAIRKGESA